jgi:hypothetical protein
MGLSPKRLVFFAFFAFVTVACICCPTNLLLLPFQSDQPQTYTPPPTSTPASTYTPAPCLDASCQDACSGLLTDIVSASEGITPMKTYNQRISNDGFYQELVRYQVKGDELSGATFQVAPASLESYKLDTTTHQEIWDFFTTLIPSADRSMVDEFVIFTDGRDDYLAAVEQDDYKPDQWTLEVDIIDAEDRKALAATLLHEFAHLLTLDVGQAEPDDYLCTQDYVNPGCGQPNSYIDQFYQAFWMDIYNEWAVINALPEGDARDELMSNFYYTYQDRFLTEYATTDASEDIAESWVYFILLPPPNADTIADQKVLFFYDFSELVDLRAEITARLCGYFLETASP